MVLFIDIIRKFSFKSFSQYLNEITKAVVREFTKSLPEAVDDDNRGLGALSIDRIGHADNLTVGKTLAKYQNFKIIEEGSPPAFDANFNSFLAVWLYMNDVNSDVQKDRSGCDGFRHIRLSFDGVNDSVDCGNDSTLWSQALTKFSFSFWIYPDTGWDGPQRRIVEHNGGNANGFNCWIDGSVANKINFEIRDGANNPFQASFTTFQLNQWHNIVCVYDNSLGTQNVKIYVDGVLGGTTANTTASINASASLMLAGTTNRFSGYMKNFKWWTTKALSAAEAAGQYKQSPVPIPNFWLPLSEGTGNPVDSITKLKTGTISGASWDNKLFTKTIKRVGNPCVVKTTQPFLGRQEVGYFDGKADGLTILDDADIRGPKLAQGHSISYWLYVPTGADALKPLFLTKNSIVLDGVNDYINLTNDATLWSQSLTKFSFSMWVYSPANPTGGADKYIISHGNASAQGIRVLYNFSDQKIVFNLKNAGGSNIQAISNAALPLNTWTHITCVYDNSLGSANIKLYINGVLQSITGNLTEALNLSAAMTIGTDQTANTPNIYVKDFHWWTTQALTAGQVDAVYRGFFWTDTSAGDYLLGMEEGTGNPTDWISGTKIGTLTNGAAWDTSIYPPYIEQIPCVIYHKAETNDDHVSIWLDPVNKRLILQERENALQMFKCDNAYAYNTWVFHAFIWNQAGNTFAFHKDGINQTLVAFDSAMNSDPATNDAYIACSGPMYGDAGGFSNIALYNFKFWKNRLLTTTETGRETANKLSISNITNVELPILGYCVFDFQDSYTKASYTSASYTTSY